MSTRLLGETGATEAMAAPVEPLRPKESCPYSGFEIFNGVVVRSRCVKLMVRGGVAKCRWKKVVEVPVGY